MRKKLTELIKRLIFRHTNFAKPSYKYNVEPAQLSELIKSIDRLAMGRKNTIVEIGVARGMTTRFLAEHISLNSYNVDYFCLDTFSSFIDKDINYEVEKRNKNKKDLLAFEYNDYLKWKKNFQEYKFIKPIKCDCSTFDFSSIAPINLCFLDVDLYLPTIKTLNNIWNFMAEDSVIIVDDVKDKTEWDGVFQAFMEFVNGKKLNYYLIGNKCGVIKK